jgi:hypothetical protein
VMPRRDAKQEFKIGRYSVNDIDPEFEHHFGSMQYEPRPRSLQARVLPKRPATSEQTAKVVSTLRV